VTVDPFAKDHPEAVKIFLKVIEEANTLEKEKMRNSLI